MDRHIALERRKTTGHPNQKYRIAQKFGMLVEKFSNPLPCAKSGRFSTDLLAYFDVNCDKGEG
jgi:hypothetical protein